MPATSTVFETLGNAWRSVEGDLGGAPGGYARRVFKESGLSVFVSLSEPNRRRAVIFEVPPRAVKSLPLAQQAKGFDVEVSRHTDAGGTRFARVEIAVTVSAFADLFGVLAADVVERAISASTEADAMRLLASRLEHWKRFAERVGLDGLGASEQTGLYGELIFLNAVLDIGLTGLEAVRAWHGPLRANQDFCFGGLAVEVKTSASNTPHMVTISNEWQLDTTGLTNLLLFHASLDRRPGSGQSLPTLVDATVRRLRASSPEAEGEFEFKLFSLGYLHAQAEHYEEYGFTERERRLYQVRGNFPRIAGGDLTDGIIKVHYVIDLACAGEFRVDLGDLKAFLHGESHGES